MAYGSHTSLEFENILVFGLNPLGYQRSGNIVDPFIQPQADFSIPFPSSVQFLETCINPSPRVDYCDGSLYRDGNVGVFVYYSEAGPSRVQFSEDGDQAQHIEASTLNQDIWNTTSVQTSGYFFGIPINSPEC